MHGATCQNCWNNPGYAFSYFRRTLISLPGHDTSQESWLMTPDSSQILWKRESESRVMNYDYIVIGDSSHPLVWDTNGKLINPWVQSCNNSRDVIAFVRVRRWSLWPTVTNDRRPFGMRTNDLLVDRERRPTSTNDNRCFFAISFGILSESS